MEQPVTVIMEKRLCASQTCPLSNLTTRQAAEMTLANAIPLVPGVRSYHLETSTRVPVGRNVGRLLSENAVRMSSCCQDSRTTVNEFSVIIGHIAEPP